MASDFESKILNFIYIFSIFHSTFCYSLNRRERVSERIDYSGSQVIRLVPKNQRQLQYLISLERNPRVEIWLAPTLIGEPVDVMIHFSDVQWLQDYLSELNLPGRILIPDVEHKITKDQNRVQLFSFMRNENEFFNDYRRYREIRKFLKEKSQQNPELTSLTTIGKSLEGRLIMCIKIGERLGSPEKPIVYIDGGMHAREWAAVSTATYIIEHLIADYTSGDVSAQYLLKYFDFYIVPVVNPDGYEYTHTSDRLWRKNRAKILGSNCMGVDLNRNYPFHWGGEGSSHNPCDETYAGPSSLSERESTALTKLILANNHRMKAYITLHSYGQYYLYPWGYNSDDSPNVKELRRVANIGHSALTAIHGTKYKVGSPGQIMYSAQGSDEMRDLGEHGFLLPKSQIIPVGEETFASVKAVAAAIINTKCRLNICRNVK